MKKVSILYLDNEPDFLPDLSGHDIELDIIHMGGTMSMELYSSNSRISAVVEELTTQKKVDLVVIGNNLGAGVEKARFVAEDMKPMTCVVWNDYYEGNERPYAELGLKHFGSRLDLRQMIPKMLGLAA